MSELTYGKHYSVFHAECLQYLTESADLGKKQYYADLTFGAGGHSLDLLKFNPNIHVLGIDQDADAIKNGHALIDANQLQDRLSLHKMNFSEFPSRFGEMNTQQGLQGIIMDLGVSSHQFDIAERGFSFKHDGPLDMRMNADGDGETAADVVNNFSEEDLANVIYEYGEERYSRRIAASIVESRQERAIETTKELEKAIFHCYPKRDRFKGIHPATRTFQALRIYVNRELQVLEEVLQDLFNLLVPGGRLLVIAFHSLEDRIVKNKFKEIRDYDKKVVNLLTKRPLRPTSTEVEQNTRSRSAKLRIIERRG